ncbi:hypothetical protein DFJ74DRAFT_723212 [Hyaloraphidium curvatum]|nr:hypothetical protein DFJ74DRAFT_723212 [Hyaloraphidium curvatum]
MGIYSLDFWADDRTLLAALPALKAVQLVEEGAVEEAGVYVSQGQTNGVTWISVLRNQDFRTVLDAMDRLTPAHLAALEPRAKELCKFGGIASASLQKHPLAVWCLLCMHAGAPVPADALEAARCAFGAGKESWAGRSAGRAKIAAAIMSELDVYAVRSKDPAIGPVRFPPEDLDKVLDHGSRYLRQHSLMRNLGPMGPTGEGERPPASWHVWVQHGCARCRKMETFAPEKNKYANFRICSACKAVRYCSAECHKADWGRHKVFCRQL